MEILVFMISIFPAISQAYNMHNFNTRCESLHAPMCRGLPYNKTFFPNTFNHLSQYEAQQFFTQFHALISVNCFKDIKLFLCSLFFPVCTVVDKPILPCRTLCKKARKGKSFFVLFRSRFPSGFTIQFISHPSKLPGSRIQLLIYFF